MRLLLISTCGEKGVVALATEAGVTAEEPLPGRGASEALMPAMRRLFAAAGSTVRDLHAVIVVNGPGSFTGVRVGLAAAKGLCNAGDVGLIALSRLALLAGPTGDVVGMLDAGRGEYFCGVYRDGRAVSEELLHEAEARRKLESGHAVACEAKVAAALGIECVAEPGAEAMLAAALLRIHSSEWSDIALTDASYLRRTDAEIKVFGQ